MITAAEAWKDGPPNASTAAPKAAKPQQQKFYQGEQTVKFGALDQRAFHDACGLAPIVGQAFSRASGEPGPHGRTPTTAMGKSRVVKIGFDAFNSLVKYNPKASGYGSPMVREVMERLSRTPEYAELRQCTVGDDLSSALGAAALTEKTLAAVPQEVKEKDAKQQKAQAEYDEASKHLEATLELDTGDPAAEEAQKEAAEVAQEAKKKLDAASKSLVMTIRAQGKAVAAAVSAGAQAAIEEARAMAIATNAFGLGSADPTFGMPAADKLKLAAAIRTGGAGFRRLMALLGQLSREALRKQAAKTHHESGSIVDLTMGSDLSEVMEDELVQLRRPGLRKAVLARYLNDALAQYQVEQKETLGKGDFVILFDESSSMSGRTPSGHTREAEGKAVVLAIAQVALKQRRGMTVHFFQNSVTHTVHIDPWEYTLVLDGGCVAVRKLMEIAQRGTAGGTSFDRPLAEALATVGKTRPHADVLMITDGQCNVADQTIADVQAMKQARGTSFFSMLVGGEAGRDTDAVSKFSTRVWAAESLLGGASDLFDLI